jgi:hypothetical protein
VATALLISSLITRSLLFYLIRLAHYSHVGLEAPELKIAIVQSYLDGDTVGTVGKSFCIVGRLSISTTLAGT